MTTTALIDADVLRYSVAYGGEYTTEEGIPICVPFEVMSERFDNKVKEICEECWADDSVLYLTSCARTSSILNIPFKQQFRDGVSTITDYKGNRKDSSRPFHWENLTLHIHTTYKTRVEPSFEADDLMSIDQTLALKEGRDTIICSIDKDLRMVEGKHYKWAVGNSPSESFTTDYLGSLELKNSKLKGGGIKFFYAQLLTGDAVDNIKGIPKCGPVKAYKALLNLNTEQEMYNKVLQMYKEEYGEEGYKYMKENSVLLWMVREVCEGNPVLYKMLTEE